MVNHAWMRIFLFKAIPSLNLSKVVSCKFSPNEKEIQTWRLPRAKIDSLSKRAGLLNQSSERIRSRVAAAVPVDAIIAR